MEAVDPKLSTVTMELIDLIKWLPQGGAAGAVILVVFLFLKQQDKASALLIAITEKFTTTLTDNQHKSDTRNEALIAANTTTQQTVNTLIRDQIISNTQMTDAIRGLQAAVNEIQKGNKP